jgi:hypothetical protein
MAFFDKKPAEAAAAVVGKTPLNWKRYALGVLIFMGMFFMLAPQDKIASLFNRTSRADIDSLSELFAGGKEKKPRIPRDTRDPKVNTVGMIYAKPGLAEELGTPVKAPRGGRSIGGILSGAEEGSGGVTLYKDELPSYLDTNTSAGEIPSESIASALDSVRVAKAGDGVKQAGTHGRLPRDRARKMSEEVKQTLSKPRKSEGRKAFAQLGAGYSRALAALGPIAPEASAATSSSLYDGMRAPSVQDRLAGATPAFDGASLPSLHDGQRIAREARRLQAETRQCQAIESKHGQAKEQQLRKMDSEAASFRDNNCRRWMELKKSCKEEGGFLACGLARLRKKEVESCVGRWGSFQLSCREYNRLECLISRACPSSSAQGCSPVDCDAMIQ